MQICISWFWKGCDTAVMWFKVCIYYLCCVRACSQEWRYWSRGNLAKTTTCKRTRDCTQYILYWFSSKESTDINVPFNIQPNQQTLILTYALFAIKIYATWWDINDDDLLPSSCLIVSLCIASLFVYSCILSETLQTYCQIYLKMEKGGLWELSFICLVA